MLLPFLIASFFLACPSLTLIAQDLLTEEDTTLELLTFDTDFEERLDIQKGKAASEYPYNPYVPVNIWNQLKPYFLPLNHPIKKKLDRIFSKERVTLSEETFLAAGFSIKRRNRPFNAIVTGHKNLKGYLLKVYLDSQLALPEWEMWLKRIKGVEVIQACLKKHKLTQFVLPRKWIYPLPAEPSPPLNGLYNRKNFILVVDDMHVLSNQENERAYKQKMTAPLLTALYTVLMECQLTDCIYIGNMPFTEYGNIAFIDTEVYHNGTPHLYRLKKHLSVPMQAHLEKLFQQEIPANLR